MENRKNTLKFQMSQHRDILIETDLAMVMKDKYPKAQYHFLVVAKENIENVTELTRDHMPLLDHMMELANQIIEQQEHLPSSNFRIGFKINAFMKSLNMHVISDDFYSVSMRRVKHWNSFNTDLFITYQAAYALLHVQGSIDPMPEDKVEELVSTKLMRCNQCSFESESLVALKNHLHWHWIKRERDFESKKLTDKVINMLKETKLEVSPSTEVAKVCDAIEDPKLKTTSWRQSSDQEPNVSNRATNTKPSEQPNNWRQGMGQQPTEQQPSVPYSNPFERHFQKSAYRQAANGQQQPQQGYVNYMPRQQTNFQQQESNQFPHAPIGLRMPYAQQQQPGANFRPHAKYQGGGYYPQQKQQSRFNQFSSDSPQHSNHFTQLPNGQHLEKPQSSTGKRMPNVQHQQRQQTESQPHFNPFKQSPNMELIRPTQYHGHRPPFKQGQNNFNGPHSITRSNKAMQNKPKWKPKPQHNQTQTNSNNAAGSSTAMNVPQNKTMQSKSNSKHTNNGCPQASPGDQDQAQAGKGKKKLAESKNEESSSP